MALSAASDVFDGTVHTSPMNLEKRLEGSEKVLHNTEKEFQTLWKNLQFKRVDTEAFRECMVRALAESHLAEQEMEVLKCINEYFMELLACIKRKIVG